MHPFVKRMICERLFTFCITLSPPCNGEINPNHDLWLISAATDYSYHTSLVLFRFSYQYTNCPPLHSTPLMASVSFNINDGRNKLMMVEIN